MNPHRILARGLLVVGLLPSACLGDHGQAPGTPEPPPTPTFTASEAAFAANLNPLNGLPSEDPDIASRRPAAFAVQAHPVSGTSGLQSAELVFEAQHPATPGLTAVTLEAPGERPDIGPLAPASWLDVAVASALGASLTASDAPDDVRAALDAAGVPVTLLATGDDSVAEPDAPVDLAAGTWPRWPFDETVDAGAVPEGALTLPAAGDRAVTWRYDEAFDVWRRVVGGQTVSDPATGAPLGVANVAVVTVAATPGQGWWIGRGPVTLLRSGLLPATGESAGAVRLDGTWQRDEATELPDLVDATGRALALRPGNTWFTLMPEPGG